MEYKKRLEEKIKLNLYMSIYNTKELINLLKEYHSKYGINAKIKKDIFYEFMAIQELQEDAFNNLEEDKGYGNN